MINVDDIGLCKALTLRGDDEVGHLVKIGENYFLSTAVTELHNNGNVKNAVNTLVQIQPDTVCAYTYMQDKYNQLVFEGDVLSPDNSDLLIYIYYDNVRGMYLYHTNRSAEEESKMEPLNINELCVIGNITRHDNLCEMFADSDGDC